MLKENVVVVGVGCFSFQLGVVVSSDMLTKKRIGVVADCFSFISFSLSFKLLDHCRN